MRRPARPGRRPPAAVLAVDGGNSKTDVALLDARGNVLGVARGTGSSNGGMGLEGSLDPIAVAVEAACAGAGIDPGERPIAAVGVYCLAGVDLPVDHRRIARALRSIGLSATDMVLNDTFAVLRAGSERSWGVAVTCGAGMNCVGVGPDGRTVRFPALGALSGDWGGGYWLGLSALTAGIRAVDGRGPKTVLARTVPAHFGLRTPRAVMEAIYLGRMPEDRLVELPPVVFAAGRAGDRAALGLIDRQADEVVAMAGAAIRRLRLARLDVEIVLGGGLFRSHDEGLLETIERGLVAIAPAARVAQLDAPPVVGAALLGLDSLEVKGRGARSRVRDALTDARMRAGSGSPGTDGGREGGNRGQDRSRPRQQGVR